MSGFGSAQAAFEAPPDGGPDWIDCENCAGSGVVVEDEDNPIEEPCDECGGEGQADPRDHPSWCDRCGMTGACPDCNPPDPDDYDDRDYS